MNVIRRPAQAGIAHARRSFHSSVRRCASDSHSASHHAPKQNEVETFGRGFYIALGIIPAAYIIYRLSAQDQNTQPWLTRYIASISDWKGEWTRRNDLHTRMIEQAAADRNLFQNSKKASAVDLRFPETFNMGSPFNVPAGHGGANLDSLIAHYEKKNFEEQEAKLKALREGTLKAEQPVIRPE